MLPIPYTDLIDVVLVASLLFVALSWLRRSRARLALVGLAMLGAIYLAARRLDLHLTAWMLQGFFAVAALILIVVFQEDLRRLFEQLAVAGLPRRQGRPASYTLDVIVRSVTQLAEARRGALFVLPGREPVERHLEGGVGLDGAISEALLQSLFDPGSPGHDGAVLVRGGRVVRFGVHLPLSPRTAEAGATAGGTRHAAALGLAERTDALCIVVSEETGRVSVAREGRLRRLPHARSLEAALRGFQDDLAPLPRRAARPGWRRLPARSGEAALALGLALVMWLLLVPGSTVTRSVRSASVELENLPPGYRVEWIEPEAVEVTLEGRRRDLYLVDPGDLRVPVDAILAQLGRRTFAISEEQVEHPPSLEVVGIDPARIRISLVRAPPAAPDPNGG